MQCILHFNSEEPKYSELGWIPGKVNRLSHLTMYEPYRCRFCTILAKSQWGNFKLFRCALSCVKEEIKIYSYVTLKIKYKYMFAFKGTQIFTNVTDFNRFEKVHLIEVSSDTISQKWKYVAQIHVCVHGEGLSDTSRLNYPLEVTCK